MNDTCKTCCFQNDLYPPITSIHGLTSVAVMFIGENPSWAEDQTVPFSQGTISGKALDDHYLKPLGLSRDEVWITDIIKCRYPKKEPMDIYHNKVKYDREIQQTAEKCSQLHLIEEIKKAQPRIIVTLSDKEVYQRFRKVFELDTPEKFTDAVGKPIPINIDGHTTTLFPMIHPDISRPLGDGDNRKLTVRSKWAEKHIKEYIPALKSYLLG